MFLKKLLKSLYFDISYPQSRFDYINAMLSNFPGEFGIVLRSFVITRFFECAGKGVRISQGARFNGVGNLKVGNFVRIGIDNFFQASGGLSIGDYTIFGPDVKIWTINHIFTALDQPILEQGYEFKPVSIGAHVWFSSNVFVMPGVEIPDGCIISAGSVVGVKKYPPFSIIAGNPARVIGLRAEQKQENNSES